MRFNRYRKQAAACLATLTLLLTGPGCSFGMTGGSATIVPLNAASLQMKIPPSLQMRLRLHLYSALFKPKQPTAPPYSDQDG